MRRRPGHRAAGPGHDHVRPGAAGGPYDGSMAVVLFAGIPVNDYTAALSWYERLLGSPPTFFPNDTEAVWELAEHR